MYVYQGIFILHVRRRSVPVSAGSGCYRGAQGSLCLITQFWYLFMPFIFVDSLYVLTQLLFHLVIHRIIYSCVRNLCHVAVSLLLLQLIYIACSCYIRLRVYTWGHSSRVYTAPTLVAFLF